MIWSVGREHVEEDGNPDGDVNGEENQDPESGFSMALSDWSVCNQRG